MILSLIGWAATAFFAISSWQVGHKRRSGFIYIIVGEFIWIGKLIWMAETWRKIQWDMLLTCIMFIGLAIRNYRKWRRQDMAILAAEVGEPA